MSSSRCRMQVQGAKTGGSEDPWTSRTNKQKSALAISNFTHELQCLRGHSPYIFFFVPTDGELMKRPLSCQVNEQG